MARTCEASVRYLVVGRRGGGALQIAVTGGIARKRQQHTLYCLIYYFLCDVLRFIFLCGTVRCDENAQLDNNRLSQHLLDNGHSVGQQTIQ